MTDGPLDPFALVGQLLDGQYRVDSVVGEGGFGVVYKGWHLSFDQPIAIKALKVPQAVDVRTQNSVLTKFREEAKLCYVLSQASLNIVRSIGFGAIDTPSGIWAPFLVLEWLDGHSLSADFTERRERGLRGRSLAETLDMLDPAARGLAYAHSKRVAHRDVKPANMFVTPLAGDPGRTTIKLLDFGIAKVMAEGATAASPQGAATAFSSFTPFYAAPEQFDPRYGPTGPWTDVYAFALVLSEMLTDRPPVEGDDVVAVIAHATDPRRRPTPRAGGAMVPEAVEAVFAHAFSVDPKARFADLGGFWDALTTSARISRPPEVAVSGHRAQQHTAPMQSAPMPSAQGRVPNDTLPMQSVPRGSTQPLQSRPLAIPAPARAPHRPGTLPTPAPVSPQVAPWAPPLPPVRPAASSASYSQGGQRAPWQPRPPRVPPAASGTPTEPARSSAMTIVAVVIGVILVGLLVALASLHGHR